MKPNESVSQMFARFTNITNGLRCLDKKYSQSEMARKILRSMPSNWETTTSILLQSKDFSTYTLDMLMGSLMTEEMHRNMKNGKEVKKNEVKNIAFKCSSSKAKSNDYSSDGSEDEEMALLAKRFTKYLKKKKFQNDKRMFRREGGKDEASKKDPIVCYECKKPGHIKYDCPNLKKHPRIDRKKAMMAT